MKRVLFLLALLLVTVGSTMAYGVDDAGLPNNPGENERANACFDDGTMAGNCDTEWEWTCGWFLIRFETDALERDLVPAMCASLLPEPVSATRTVAVDGERRVNIGGLAAGCYTAAGNSLRWPGGPGPVTASYYHSGDMSCSGSPMGTATYVAATSSQLADRLCPSGVKGGTSYRAAVTSLRIYMCN